MTKKQILFSLLILTLISSCSGENKTKNSSNFRKNLINPYYIDQIFNTPNNFGSFWISKHINQLDVNKISISLRGGSNPDDILEKYHYSFDENGNNDNYSYLYRNKILDTINQSNFEYVNNSLSKINIYKYYGVGNLPPVIVQNTENSTIFIKSKANGKNDSLFFYPNVENPKLIIDKIGKFINYMEIFVRVGATKKEIIDQLNSVYPYLSDFELADKTITYVKDGLPIESYHLGENWIQLERAQQWEYNKYNQVIHFKEWMHGTMIKNVDIMYNENSLPKKITLNRKKYLINYSKN